MTSLDIFEVGVREVRTLLSLSAPAVVAEDAQASSGLAKAPVGQNLHGDASSPSCFLGDSPGASDQAVIGPSNESAVTGSGDGSSQDKDNAVRRASVVLLVSHFESFLKSIAEAFVDELGEGSLEARQIPVGIRELHTVPRMAEIIASKDTTQRHALLKKLSALSLLWNDAAKPPPGTLSAGLFSREVTSAKAEKIDNLFRLMGSTSDVCDGDIDIAPGEDEVITSNIRLALSDVIQCRNDIAHGDLSRKPTAVDIERYIEFLEALAGRLQRKADAILQSIVS